nr:unnamed protein product [Digitaria exilis]
MSRMKHLLRKLHLAGGAPAGGGGGTGAAPDHHRPRHRRSGHPAAAATTTTPPPPPPVVVAAAAPETAATPAVAVVAPVTGEPRGLEAEAATTRLEEDYQVRLALAISASDHAGLVDADSVQIRAAELISLGGAAAGAAHDRSPAEALAARYWNHSVVNYDEKLPDGFYDLCGAQLHPGFQAKFPSLDYLRAAPLVRDVAFLAVLVDRERDPALKRLEDRAAAVAVQTRAQHGAAAAAQLAQKIAGLVVNAMGGVVEDADGMNREWSFKSRELSLQLNSVVLPLGSLRVGLSRHRSLLFKVLADRVNLPCKLVKGICYTGTDEGAVNLVKVDYGSTEYIIDLMGAPGTLIPSDISGSQFQDSNNNQLGSDAIEESVAELCLALEQINGGYENRNDVGGSSSDHSSILALNSNLADLSQAVLKQNLISEKDLEGDISEHIKANDVSKYVLPEVVDQQFAQNLHDLLLESGALLPTDLLTDQNSHNIHDKESGGWLLVAQTRQNLPNGLVAKDSSPPHENAQHPAENAEETIRDLDLHDHTSSAISNEDQRAAEDSLMNMSGSSNGNLDKLSWSSTKTISSVIDDVAEYEIPWEDLEIGERIGLGSYGEVYHADWNGTEVAVKKFLDQDLSGVSLEQFKCEAKGMNYLHSSHPTIVHRDLKSPNLLVDKNWVVKVTLPFYTVSFNAKTQLFSSLCATVLHFGEDLVSDFGMSRLKHHTFLSSKSTAGTVIH